jgi:hypothetical protein
MKKKSPSRPVVRTVRRRGNPEMPCGMRLWPAEKVMEFIRLYNERMPLKDLAEKMGYERSAHLYMSQLAIQLRRAGYDIPPRQIGAPRMDRQPVMRIGERHGQPALSESKRDELLRQEDQSVPARLATLCSRAAQSLRDAGHQVDAQTLEMWEVDGKRCTRAALIEMAHYNQRGQVRPYTVREVK